MPASGAPSRGSLRSRSLRIGTSKMRRQAYARVAQAEIEAETFQPVPMLVAPESVLHPRQVNQCAKPKRF